MVTTQALAKTIDNDPQFNVRILYLLSKDLPSRFLTTYTL